MTDSTMGSKRGSFRGSNIQKNKNIEGYLEVIEDNIFNLRESHKYFTIRRNMLYVYKKETAENAVGNIDLKNCTSCKKLKDKRNCFQLDVKMPDSEEEKMMILLSDSYDLPSEVWVNAINKAVDSQDPNTFIGLNTDEVELFNDFKPMFIDNEPVPPIQYTGSFANKKGQKPK